MKLTVILPVYNERENLPHVLPRVQALDLDKEIVIVDNCSTDGTWEWLLQLDEPGVRVVLQPENYLKGTSVRKGIELAQGEYCVVQDADQEYDPEEIPGLLSVAEGQPADAVFGSRFLTPGQGAARGGWHAFGRNRLNDLFRVLYWNRATDIATCYKLVRTDVLRSLRLRSAGFDLDYEIAAKLAKRGHRIVEVPVTYRARTAAEGKKLTWRDGVPAALALLRFRFTD